MPFLGPKGPTCHEQNFFRTNHYYFHLTTGPFYCTKFKKVLTADLELWGCTIFGPRMVHLPQFFFWKITNIILIYLLAPFIAHNLKKKSKIQKVQTPCFWVIFDHFCLMGILSPNTKLSFRKKLMSQSQESLRTEWKDGQTLFYRTILAEARGPITINFSIYPAYPCY